MLRLLLKVISICSIAIGAAAQPFSFHDPAWLASQSSSSAFVPTNFPDAFVEVLSDNTTCITNTLDASAIVSIFNISTQMHFGNDNDRLIPVTANANSEPFYRKTGGPTGQPTIDFHNVASSGMKFQFLINTNQPTTMFCVVQHATTGTQVFEDSVTAARELMEMTSTIYGMFAGNTVSTTLTPNSGWEVWTAVFKSGTAYLRTNGVLCASGSCGGNGIGQMVLGTDNTSVAPLNGKMCAYLAYGSELNTNAMQAIESGLRVRYGF